MQAEKSTNESFWSRRPPKSEQLRIVAEEAARIRNEHSAGRISATDAARQLSDLKTRYAGIIDSFLAL